MRERQDEHDGGGTPKRGHGARRRAPHALAAVIAATTLALIGAGGAAADTTTESVCPPAPAGVARCQAELVVNAASGTPVQPADTGAPAPSTGTPQWLQWAYDLEGPSAQGPPSPDTVAIVDPYGYANAESDLATYRSTFGLPPCTTANGCFAKVNQSGGTTSYPADPTVASGNSGWLIEDSLDLDMVSAICPTCHILFVEANSAGDGDLSAAERTAASRGPKQITNSWSWTGDNTNNAAFAYGSTAVVAATGDGAYNSFGWPAILPYVTAAGGTVLPRANNPRGFAETAWSGTASGCANGVSPAGFASKPAWQHDTGCPDRTLSDLSADASSTTGVVAYGPVSRNGMLMTRFFSAGGTSVASPIIAGYYALLGGGAGNGGAAWAYANSSLLNDITSGSDGSCPTATLYWCTAQAGYDGPTGVGSISGDAIAGPPQVGGSYATAISDTTATLQGGAYANQHDTQAFWQYGTTNSYGQATPVVDIGGAPGVAAVSTPVTGLTPGTAYHFRLVAASCAGTNYGFDTTLTTSAPATTSTTTSTSSTTTAPTSTSTSSLASTTSSNTMATAEPCAQTSTTSTTVSSSATSTAPPTGSTPPTTQTSQTVSATPAASAQATTTTTSTTHTTTRAATATVAAFAVATSSSVQHHGNQVQVRVRCNRRCAGSISLRYRGQLIGSARVALRRVGFSGFVTVKLNAHGRKLIRARHRLATVATLALNGHSVRRSLLIT